MNRRAMPAVPYLLVWYPMTDRSRVIPKTKGGLFFQIRDLAVMVKNFSLFKISFLRIHIIYVVMISEVKGQERVLRTLIPIFLL
jgi:hypothetical protein